MLHEPCRTAESERNPGPIRDARVALRRPGPSGRHLGRAQGPLNPHGARLGSASGHLELTEAGKQRIAGEITKPALGARPAGSPESTVRPYFATNLCGLGRGLVLGAVSVSRDRGGVRIGSRDMRVHEPDAAKDQDRGSDGA